MNPYNLLLTNPATPRLYGLPKIHKPSCPIRPVVSFTNSPSYKLFSCLNSILRDNCELNNPCSLRNTFDLTEKLSDYIIPPESRLISFDVVNLFPSVPTNECISLVRNNLFKSNMLTHHVLDICSLLGLALEQNFFKFNNNFYKQKTGLAMGSNLSPFLAEIFMSNLENNHITNNNPFKDNILFWFRYVDDCLVLFNGDDEILGTFLEYLNSLHNNIKFTFEIESDNFSLNFLDLLITRKDSHFEYAIYRKPTHTDTIIPSHSCHPISHKLSTFNSLFHRLFKIPLSDDNFKKELDIIKYLAKINGYKYKTIFGIFNKFRSKALSFHVTNANVFRKSYHSLSYFGIPSKIVGNIFKTFGINISFKTTSNLNSYLVNTKDILSPQDKSGVYKLNCNNCNSFYIGQSGRKFIERIKEHMRHIRQGRVTFSVDTPSSFANHIISENHNFILDTNFEILHVCKKGRLLDSLEVLEICKATNNSFQNCLNDCVDFPFKYFYNAFDFNNLFPI